MNIEKIFEIIRNNSNTIYKLMLSITVDIIVRPCIHYRLSLTVQYKVLHRRIDGYTQYKERNIASDLYQGPVV